MLADGIVDGFGFCTHRLALRLGERPIHILLLLRNVQHGRVQELSQVRREQGEPDPWRQAPLAASVSP